MPFRQQSILRLCFPHQPKSRVLLRLVLRWGGNVHTRNLSSLSLRFGL